MSSSSSSILLLSSLLFKRPYVVSLVVTFMIVASAERGVVRMLVWLLVGSFLGWLSEFSSTRIGFPYGFYDYHTNSFKDEMFISNIPLFASLSFAALGYFGFSLAYTLLSPLKRGTRPYEIVRLEDPRCASSFHLAVVASFLVAMSDLVIDPITHLGRYWFLGDLYAYKMGDFGWLSPIYDLLRADWHFQIPLSNYVGWLITFFIIVRVNQLIDRLFPFLGLKISPSFTLPYCHLWAFFYFVGNYLFMLVIVLRLASNPQIPSEKHIYLMVVNTLFVMIAFIVMIISHLHSKLHTHKHSHSHFH